MKLIILIFLEINASIQGLFNCILEHISIGMSGVFVYLSKKMRFLNGTQLRLSGNGIDNRYVYLQTDTKGIITLCMIGFIISCVIKRRDYFISFI